MKSAESIAMFFCNTCVDALASGNMNWSIASEKLTAQITAYAEERVQNSFVEKLKSSREAIEKYKREARAEGYQECANQNITPLVHPACAKALAEALEEAAKVAENQEPRFAKMAAPVCRSIAEVIRALKGKP